MVWQSNVISFTIYSAFFFVLLNLMWTRRVLHLRQCSSGINISKSIYTFRKASHILNPAFPSQFPSKGNTNINNHNDFKSIKPKLAFADINFNIARWDNFRLYKFLDFALVGETFDESSTNNLVCLATQSSVERLYSLVQVARHWAGPISVAVFVAGNEELSILQHYVTYMRLCYNYIHNNVTFHVAVPSGYVPDYASMKIMDRFDCQYPERTLYRLLNIRTTETIRWRLKNEYPQNHLRNLARKGCQSKYVFLTDIDIIPSKNIVTLLNIFLRSVNCSSQCAYVIPTFEIDVRAKFPGSKIELLRLYKKGLVRPFHEKVFIYNQYATNFSR